MAKIKIKLAKREVDLTPDEARDVWMQLNELFAEKRVEYVPYTVPQAPIQIIPPVQPEQWPKVWCQGDTFAEQIVSKN